jgi:hypothetical protein
LGVEEDFLVAVGVTAGQVVEGAKGDPGAVGTDGGVKIGAPGGVGDLGEAGALGVEEDFGIAVSVAAG